MFSEVCYHRYVKEVVVQGQYPDALIMLENLQQLFCSLYKYYYDSLNKHTNKTEDFIIQICSWHNVQMRLYYYDTHWRDSR